MFETPTPENPIEALKAELSALTSERELMLQKIAETGENIDAELGSAEYVDFGYTERLREVEVRIAEIEATLTDKDDVDSAQRNLHL